MLGGGGGKRVLFFIFLFVHHPSHPTVVSARRLLSRLSSAQLSSAQLLYRKLGGHIQKKQVMVKKAQSVPPPKSICFGKADINQHKTEWSAYTIFISIQPIPRPPGQGADHVTMVDKRRSMFVCVCSGLASCHV